MIPKISDLVINEEGVLKQLQGLSPNKAAGPDELPLWFLRMFAVKLATILTDIFQSSINIGTLPHQWREANICGIFKKRDKSLPENYRPVSLTSVTCKILEDIIHSHVMDHLERFDILVDAQHGFRAMRSTETQLILTVDDITETVEQRSSIHMAILDFSKAFDKVPHKRRLTKLAQYGIQGNLHSWLRNFFTDRTQRVTCEGNMSSSQGIYQACLRGQFWSLFYFSSTLMICQSS